VSRSVARLVHGEAEVGGANLEQLTGHAQTMKPKLWIVARGEDHA
jgi:hypothetical protein